MEACTAHVKVATASRVRVAMFPSSATTAAELLRCGMFPCPGKGAHAIERFLLVRWQRIVGTEGAEALPSAISAVVEAWHRSARTAKGAVALGMITEAEKDALRTWQALLLT